MMFVVFIDFWITERNFPAGRPLDKNRNVIYDNNTCTASRKEEKNVTKTTFRSVSLSLSYSLKQKV